MCVYFSPPTLVCVAFWRYCGGSSFPSFSPALSLFPLLCSSNLENETHQSLPSLSSEQVFQWRTRFCGISPSFLFPRDTYCASYGNPVSCTIGEGGSIRGPADIDRGLPLKLAQGAAVYYDVPSTAAAEDCGERGSFPAMYRFHLEPAPPPLKGRIGGP